MRQLPNWLWAALVLALIGVVVWGWAFDFSRGSRDSSAQSRHRPRYPVVIDSPVVVAATRLSPDFLVGYRARLVSTTRLAFTTVGSSSCPTVPDQLVVENRNTIRLHLVTGSWVDRTPVAQPPASGICTADLGTTRMLIAIDPKLVDTHHRLTVRVVYRESTKPDVWTVPALTG